MTEPTTNPGNAHDLRNLLEAVLEAVTLPHGTAEYARRLESRADWVRAAVKGALEEDPADIGWNADFLRGRLAAEEADAAEREHNRCARYADTPHCRSCVDNCHDGCADHACVICNPARYGAVR